MTFNLQHFPYNISPPTFHLQHFPYNISPTTSSLQHFSPTLPSDTFPTFPLRHFTSNIFPPTFPLQHFPSFPYDISPPNISPPTPPLQHFPYDISRQLSHLPSSLQAALAGVCGNVLGCLDTFGHIRWNQGSSWVSLFVLPGL